MFNQILKWFKKERCFVCDNILTREDKKEGGCGFSGGLNETKTFRYCKECSSIIINEALSGKKSKFMKIIEKKLRSREVQKR